jgi:very-short-patch-repair endonuclease
MTVVSALHAADLDPARLKSRGALMLRDFLAYAESGGVSGAAASQAAAPAVADPLRHDLAERLRRAGLTVHEDHGAGAHRIDLAVEDPYHHGRGLLAVETDGPRYAAHRSTRERDRLRAEQLGRLGWQHVRVWSTDVFRDPAREIARIVTMARDQPFVTRAEAVGDSDGVDDQDPVGEASEVDGSTVESGDAGSGNPDSNQGSGSGTDDQPEATPKGKARRKRRRAFRKGTAGAEATGEGYGPTQDDLDLGWGEGANDETARDRWLEEQRPPHYQ